MFESFEPLIVFHTQYNMCWFTKKRNAISHLA